MQAPEDGTRTPLQVRQLELLLQVAHYSGHFSQSVPLAKKLEVQRQREVLVRLRVVGQVRQVVPFEQVRQSKGQAMQGELLGSS